MGSLSRSRSTGQPSKPALEPPNPRTQCTKRLYWRRVRDDPNPPPLPGLCRPRSRMRSDCRCRLGPTRARQQSAGVGSGRTRGGHPLHQRLPRDDRANRRVLVAESASPRWGGGAGRVRQPVSRGQRHGVSLRLGRHVYRTGVAGDQGRSLDGDDACHALRRDGDRQPRVRLRFHEFRAADGACPDASAWRQHLLQGNQAPLQPACT